MLNKPKVLVVDDVPENIQTLISVLKNDYAVQVATGGKKAIELATKEPHPDIVLLDILMPGMDGYEVCRELKENKITKGIPVIFVTALSESEDEAKGLELGAVDFITKPINPELVRARVSNQLELKLYRDHLKHELSEKEEIIMVQSRHAAMGEMIGIIAHQWRQPLTTISMEANNIIAGAELEDIKISDCKESSKRIAEQTAHLSKTIDDFRNFFRPNTAKEEAKLEDIVVSTQKILSANLSKFNVELVTEVLNSKSIMCYPRELMHVYINLFKNAVDVFVDRDVNKPQINVTVDSDEEFIISTICDNGGGIDEERIDKLFNLYFSTKDEKKGLGLGLYITKIIVEKHLEGTISVENINGGACFKIMIPLSKNR